MKYRTAMWAIVGFLLAGFWAVYGLASTPAAFTSADPMMPLVRFTCPIALLSFYPIRLYWVPLANAATYALVGLMVETLRQRLSHAK
jgi:hypothetical protein